MASAESQDPKNPDYYDYGNGNGKYLDDHDKKVMHPSSGIKGFEWHPAGVNPDNGKKFLKHHTYIDYKNGCRNCERLEDARIHPNGSKPWE
jgi:hypothetical protein